MRAWSPVSQHSPISKRRIDKPIMAQEMGDGLRGGDVVAGNRYRATNAEIAVPQAVRARLESYRNTRSRGANVK